MLEHLKNHFKHISLANLVWDKILAVHFYRFERVPERQRYSLRSLKYFRITLGMIRSYLLDLFARVPEIPKDDVASPVDYLFLKSLPRADYDDLFFKIIDTTEGRSSCVYNDLTYRKSINTAGVILFVKHAGILLYLIRKIGSHAAVFFYIKMIGYLQIAKMMEVHRPKVVVVFADMQPLDNAIAQHFKNLGSKTITLQHGLYVDYGNTHTVNVVNYENTVAEYFLAWGKNTSDLILQHHPNSKVIICGKPTLLGVVNPSRDSLIFMVLFDQKMYASHNQQLLDIACEIASRHNWTISLRLHPTTSLKDYTHTKQVRIDTAAVKLENLRFVVGHTTSMMYELLRRGMPVFQLKSDIPCHPLPEALRFEQASDLMTRLEQNSDYSAIGKHFVELTGKESLLKYKNTLLSL